MYAVLLQILITKILNCSCLELFQVSGNEHTYSYSSKNGIRLTYNPAALSPALFNIPLKVAKLFKITWLLKLAMFKIKDSNQFLVTWVQACTLKKFNIPQGETVLKVGPKTHLGQKMSVKL